MRIGKFARSALMASCLFVGYSASGAEELTWDLRIPVYNHHQLRPRSDSLFAYRAGVGYQVARLSSREVAHELPFKGYWSDAILAPDGKAFAVVLFRTKFRVTRDHFRADSPFDVVALDGGEIGAADFSPSSRFLISLQRSGERLSVVSVEERREVQSLRQSFLHFAPAKCGADDCVLTAEQEKAGGLSRTTYLRLRGLPDLGVRSEKRLRTENPGAFAYVLGVSPAGKHVATIESRNEVMQVAQYLKIRALPDFREVFSTRVAELRGVRVFGEFSASGRYFTYTDSVQSVSLVDLGGLLARERVLLKETSDLNSRKWDALAVSEDDSFVAIGGRNGRIDLASISAARPVHAIGNAAPVMDLRFSLDSSLLYTVGFDGSVREWRNWVSAQ